MLDILRTGWQAAVARSISAVWNSLERIRLLVMLNKNNKDISSPHALSTLSAILVRRQYGWNLLSVGLLWLPVGMALVPGPHASSVYHWSVALLLLVPALWVLIAERGQSLRDVPRVAWLGCALLFVWACITLLWAGGSHLAERMKVPLFVVLYLYAWLAWGRERPVQVLPLLRLTGFGMALSAVVAMLAYPWRDIVWTHRMVGFDMLDGPNLSAYAMAAAFVWLVQVPPARSAWRVAWAAALAVLTIFVAWTGSRGAWLALFVCMVSLPLWHPGRLGRWLAGGGLLAVVAVLVFDPMQLLHRGMSYRPQIFARAVEMIERHPWGGLGLGSKYTITVGTNSWTHSHNLFSNTAIELGLVGLACWLLVWVWVGWTGWRNRMLPLGRVVLGLWIFASVALQFDGPSLLRSPRAEWLLTWLPLALAMLVAASHGLRDGTSIADR